MAKTRWYLHSYGLIEEGFCWHESLVGAGWKRYLAWLDFCYLKEVKIDYRDRRHWDFDDIFVGTIKITEGWIIGDIHLGAIYWSCLRHYYEQLGSVEK